MSYFLSTLLEEKSFSMHFVEDEQIISQFLTKMTILTKLTPEVSNPLTELVFDWI